MSGMLNSTTEEAAYNTVMSLLLHHPDTLIAPVEPS